MDDAHLADAAHAEIARLCAGGTWRMSIPANPERDSDLILSDALVALEARTREAKADAWDEGLEAGKRLVEQGFANPNPYRH